MQPCCVLKHSTVQATLCADVIGNTNKQHPLKPHHIIIVPYHCMHQVKNIRLESCTLPNYQCVFVFNGSSSPQNDWPKDESPHISNAGKQPTYPNLGLLLSFLAYNIHIY